MHVEQKFCTRESFLLRNDYCFRNPHFCGFLYIDLHPPNYTEGFPERPSKLFVKDTNSGRPVVNSSGETSHQRSAQESDGLGVERSSFLTEQANWRLGGAADRNLLIRAAPELGHRASTHGVEQYGRVGHAVAV